MVFISSKNVTSLFSTLSLLSLQQFSTIVIAQSLPVVEDWNQIGNDIDGEAANDYFGGSVAMSADGKTIAVGASGNDGGGDNAGHARIYRLDVTSDRYTQFGPDMDGKAARDAFGVSLALSADGNTIAAGVPGIYSGNTVNSGYIQLFRVDTATQSSDGPFQQIVGIFGEAAGDQFGQTLDMSADGSKFIVGAPYNDGNGTTSGQARVFMLDASSPQGYMQIGPDLDGKSPFDEFGTSVAMSADGATIAVGEVGKYCYDCKRFIRAYKLNAISNQYNQIGTNIVGAWYGRVLDMSADGSTIAIGWADLVTVYKIDSLGQEYIKLGLDIGGVPDDNSVSSVAMSADGSRIAVGAIANDENGDDAGTVRVYQFDPSDVSGQPYKQLGTDIDGERAGDQFGGSLDMSNDGTMIIVGSRYNNGSKGHVRVFRYSSVVKGASCGFFCSIWKFICSIF